MIEKEIAAHPVTRCEPGERRPSSSRPGWSSRPFIPVSERAVAEGIAKKIMRKSSISPSRAENLASPGSIARRPAQLLIHLGFPVYGRSPNYEMPSARDRDHTSAGCPFSSFEGTVDGFAAFLFVFLLSCSSSPLRWPRRLLLPARSWPPFSCHWEAPPRPPPRARCPSLGSSAPTACSSEP